MKHGSLRKKIGVMAIAAALLVALPLTVLAVVGDLLATVNLPGNGSCNVGITTDGKVVVAVQGSGCASSTLGVYDPPAVPPVAGAATLVATKSVKDAAGVPVTVSVVDWDPDRSSPGSMKLWAAYGKNVWLIDVGDPTVSGDALATPKFTHTVPGGLIDGLARDPSDDTLYWSRDASCCVWQFSLGTDINPLNPALGTLMNTVTSKNEAGVADGQVSGIAIGADLADGTGTLYIGRDGAAEIRRVNKSTGGWISNFATTSGRVEDLVCDPVTYAPLEAILAKDAYSGLYEAFEVETGTCPLQAEEPEEFEVALDIKPGSCPNPLETTKKGVTPAAILGTPDLDVIDIEITSLRLEGVSPLRTSLEDVATPYTGGISDPPDREDCTTDRKDGITDLTMKFDTPELVAALGPVADGDVVVLTLTGELTDGTPFTGQDVVWIKGKGKP